MREDDFNRDGVRSHKRKRQRADKILNISIGIVLLLILLVGGQFIFGGNSEEPAVSDKLEENDEEAVEEESDTNESADSEDPIVEKEEEEQEEPQSSEEESNETEEEIETSNEESDTTTTDQETNNLTPQQGNWKPIGTVQPEPFTAVYKKDHINWQEMRTAFQYATGLGDDIVLWRVGNGGNHESAVGVVADANTKTTPYQVRIEWVTNEGWKPVSVEQLKGNQYTN
ncbi:YrrS family protein [Bacillaceae bacterium IKA-2]|nr:YrrS family protein [Bacillaceae bacterium IKA-2]